MRAAASIPHETGRYRFPLTPPGHLFDLKVVPPAGLYRAQRPSITRDARDLASDPNGFKPFIDQRCELRRQFSARLRPVDPFFTDIPIDHASLGAACC